MRDCVEQKTVYYLRTPSSSRPVKYQYERESNIIIGASQIYLFKCRHHHTIIYHREVRVLVPSLLLVPLFLLFFGELFGHTKPPFFYA